MTRSTQRSARTNASFRVRHRVIAVGATVALVATGCGGKSGSEAALEQLIEQEAGGDVDIDFDDSGSFSVQTEEGEFSIDIGDDGTFSFDSDEGSGSFDIDAGGDGSGQLTFEGDDGTETIDLEAGDDGFTLTDENGESMLDSGGAIPEEWPSDVPEPEDLTGINGSFFSQGDLTSLTVIGSFEGGSDIYLQTYQGVLADAGFTETSTYNSPGLGSGFTAERDGWTISVNGAEQEGAGQIVVSLVSDG